MDRRVLKVATGPADALGNRPEEIHMRHIRRRRATVGAAILAHDGEARASRDAYAKLQVLEQGALHLYLTSLDRPHHLEFKR